jgi:hypothetical protein
MPLLRRTYASLSLEFTTPSHPSVNMHDASALSVPSAPFPAPALQPKAGKPMPLRRTYASLSLDTTPSHPSVNMHDTSVLSVPSAPFPAPALQPKAGKPIPLRRTYASLSLDTTPSHPSVNMYDTALQPKVGKPVVKFPSTRLRSPLLSSRQSTLHRRFSHVRVDGQKFPHFKRGLNLYRQVLRREFLRATKKAKINNVEAHTT